MANEGTGPVIPIKGSYQANPAFLEATKDLREWSGQVKANINAAKDSVAGFKETIEFARQALTGFGAVGLAKDILGIATGAYDAARGLAQFVLDAKAAGVAVEEDTLGAVSQLTTDLDLLKKEAMGLGVALADPFIGHLDRATIYLAEWLKGIRSQLEHGAKSMEESVGQGARGAIGNVTLPSWMNKSPELDKGNFGDEWDGEGGEQVGSRLAAERAQQDKREADELARRQAHAERLRMQQQAEYERNFQADLLKEQQEDLRKAERAQQAMIQYAHTEAEKLQAVQMWQDQQLALVAGHEDAETRIKAEGERRRAEIVKKSRDEETRQRQQAHKQNLENTKQTLQAGIGMLGAAFGQSKGLRIAEALVNTYTGVSAALAKGPAGIPMAAIIAAQGFAQVANIKSTNPGGGGGGGGLSFSSPSFSSPPSPAPSPSASPLAPVAAQSVNKIELAVSFKGSLLTEEKISQGVMDAIEIASRDGRTSIVTRKD